LGATLLCFESFLRPLRCTLKPGGSHLRRGAALLLQDVALQLLFGNRLTAAPKGSRLYGSRTYILLSKVALTTDISKRLVDGSVIKLAHKGCCGSRVKSACCASERANTLLCGSQTKSASLHKSLLRKSGRGTRAIGGLLKPSLPRPSCPCSPRRGLPQLTFQRRLQSTRARSSVTSNTQSALCSLR
jgi:hypothetical protein